MSSRTKQVGGSGEFAVIHHLLQEKWDVYRDVTDSCEADLIVKRGSQLVTVQVKTVSATKAGSIAIKLWKRQRGRGDIPYVGNEFDVMAVYVVDRSVAMFFGLKELLSMGSKAHLMIRMDEITRSDQRSYRDFTSFERCVRPVE